MCAIGQDGARLKQADTRNVVEGGCNVAHEGLRVRARRRQGGNVGQVCHGNVKHGGMLRSVSIKQQSKLTERHSREERV